MDENKNTTQASGVKPTVAKVSKATDKITSPQNQSVESAAENIFASVYINQKKNAEEAIRTETSTKVEIKSPAKKPDNSNKKLNTAFIVLLIVTILLFIASAVFLVYGLFKNNDSEGDKPAGNTNTISAEIASPFSYKHIYSNSYPDGMQEKYKQLYDQNAQVAGWITVPGTSIDMPVYKAKNNSYYLKTDNYHVYNKYGVAFLDMYAGIKNLSKNTVIYAHNFDNGLIFDELHNYADPEFFKENPVIEYNSIYADYKWKVIAAFYTNGDTSGDNGYLFYYIATNMGNNSFMEFYDELQQRSIIHTGVDVQPTDKILTLSTCTYFFDRNGSLENARFAVVARLVREGESEEIDESLVKLNENVRYPQLYYDVFGGSNPYRNASKWEATNY